MRIGIFSDTHANLEAIDVVLAALQRDKVDKLVCLGDTVGYGASPDECCNLVRQATSLCVLGNHDAAVAGRMDYSYYYDAARQALDLHASLVSDENMTWLKTLPYIAHDGDIAYCHGSPINLEEYEYIFAPDQAMRCLPQWDQLAAVTFIGHSHLCKSFALTPEEVYEVVSRDFELRPKMRYIISVGSVGQPRDEDPRASYAIYDTEKRYFENKRVPYDISAAAHKIFQAKLERNFGERLFRGL